MAREWVALMGFERRIGKWDSLDPDLKILAQMAAASSIECSWCLDFGYFLAHQKGMDLAKLEAVPNWRNSASFSKLEREVLEYAEAATATPPAVTDELAASLRRSLGDAAFVELTMSVVVLDSLTPMQRAVFVLREVFEFPHEEIAETLGKSPVAIRQIAHRARARVRDRRPPLRPPTSQELEVARKFMEASATGDLQGLLSLLAPDAVLLSDGGGKKRAALLPLHGADAIGRFLMGIRTRIEGDLQLEYRTVNAAPATLVHLDEELDSVLILELGADGIRRIYFVRNPDKLRGLREPRRLARKPTAN